MIRKKVLPLILFMSALALASGPVKAHGEDDPLLFMLMFDQFEWQDTTGGSAFAWDAESWLGKDLEKIWIKLDGEREPGRTTDAELRLLYSKAISTYWDLQAGIRHDFEPSPARSWASIGISGLAPYFFEVDAALFIGEAGRTAFRFDARYELLLTQRLILTPRIEMNFYGKRDASVGIGSGLSEIESGIRLRYEIRREIAPYIGYNWSRQVGNTADATRTAGSDPSESQLVIGLHAWF